MASASYSEDLTCSICLSIFMDPVILLCGHAFCRECIENSLTVQHQCPQCRADVPKEGKYLLNSSILKNLAEKEIQRLSREQGNGREVNEQLCPEHEEKLKLFCVTDQQLACIICRDGEKHDGHRFKPVKEAAAVVRKEVEPLVQHISDYVCATERLANTQSEEIRKTKGKSQQLTTQICRQFEEMHDFLRKREDQMKNELKHKEDEAVQEMSETLTAMETALTESRALEEQVTSALKITDCEEFLKNWIKKNSKMTPEQLFSSIAKDFQVVKSCLSLGPYESHLQFYVWKEMLQVIQPREEQLSLQSTSSSITVSDDGRDLMYAPVIIPSANCTPCTYCGRNRYSGFGFASYPSVRCSENTTQRCASAFSSSEFTSGQHYWEIEVGKRNYWKVGTGKDYLCFDQEKYVTSRPDTELELPVTGRPQKIGLYLDCVSAELSFYDAQNMTLLHTMTNCDMSAPVKAFIEYRFSKGADHNPLRVCWL